LFDDLAMLAIDDGPGASEHQGPAHRREGDGHERQHGRNERGPVVSVADRHDAQEVQEEEDARPEEGQAEQRHAPAAFANAKAVGCHECEWPIHRPPTLSSFAPGI
jgi:hypothetical protein